MGKKGGDLTRTARVDALYNHLMKGGYVTLQWYESNLQMSYKTLGRDIDTLRDRGVPIEESANDDGAKRYSVALSARKIMVPHTIDEVTALFLGRSMFDFLEGTSLQK
ncbi:MAG: hypothetical protein JXX14_01270, partial [Deltaproteobacteria bacterium]|nr:hypothetical protein [Deltaproteobacteria bacterium]